MAGLSFLEPDSKVFLAHMASGTSGAKIPRWRTRIRGAWLIKVGHHLIGSIRDVCHVLATLQDTGVTHIPLLFSHPEI